MADCCRPLLPNKVANFFSEVALNALIIDSNGQIQMVPPAQDKIALSGDQLIPVRIIAEGKCRMCSYKRHPKKIMYQRLIQCTPGTPTLQQARKNVQA